MLSLNDETFFTLKSSILCNEVADLKINDFYLPEKIEARAAIMKLITTPGPANFRATIPATRYIPVPTQEPTPREVKSIVVKHRCGRKDLVNFFETDTNNLHGPTKAIFIFFFHF